MMELFFLEIVLFITGMATGSFLNVCIARIPEGISIVWPGSMCPKCRGPIKWRDNIPVASWLALRGRCRSCGEPISPRYAAVELLGGLSAISVFFSFGPSLTGLIYFALISSLIVVAFIDLDHGIIPDVITIPGVFAGLAASFFLPDMTFFDSVTGALAGWGVLFAVAWSYKKMTGVDGMGGGDIKLLAMIGAFTGWGGALFALFVASMVGTLAGLLVMAAASVKGDSRNGDDGQADNKKGNNRKADNEKAENRNAAAENRMRLSIPFGPFLSIGSIVYLFFGAAVVGWYLNV